MTGIEYMNTICPTTSVGREPNREDIADAFEDGVAEGYKLRWKPSKKQLKALQMVKDSHYFMYQQDRVAIETLLEQLKSL